jgi:hypothetical protein
VLARVTQQPPSHWLPPQQGAPDPGDVDVPGLPQTTQRLELLHTVLASEHLLPVQQGCPAPPQGTQVLVVLLDVLLQAVPGSRQAPPTADVEQQVCPVAPQALQR